MTTKKKADPQASHKVGNHNFKSNVTPSHTKKPLGKADRILLRLRTDPRGLNRFEAEREEGDHCLNTTIAILRAEGWLIAGEWEYVPTRYGKPAHVLRYRHIGYRNPAEVAEEIAAIIGNGGAR